MGGKIVISAKVDQGLSLATQSGEPLHIAVVDSSGRVVQSGALLRGLNFDGGKG